MNPNLLSVFPIKKQELLTLHEHLSSLPVFGWGPCCISYLCCSIMYLSVLSSVLWSPLRFPNKTMFGSPFPPGVCRRAHVSFMLFVFVFVYTDVQSILRCVCFSSSSCILRIQCCQFLWIVNSWLPLRYSLTFICSVYYVPNVASFSGMSILDYPFGIL